MKSIILGTLLMYSLSCYSQVQVTSEDLEVLIGNWEGSLTYLDYQTGQPYTMPANVTISQGRSKDRLVLKNIYPNEPKANSSDKIKITKDGMRLNKNVVTSREELENGRIQIQTEHKAKDDNKRALIRNTYIIGVDTFLIRKEVQFEESNDWIKRSEFNYHKNQ